MTRLDDQRGFTIVELLVGMLLFALISVGFYQVMFMTRSGSQTAQDVVAVSEEARLAFNRIIRDTREASVVRSITRTASAESYELWIDFDNDSTEDAAPADLAGSHEVVRYTWNGTTKTISITSGTTTEVLMRGVDCVQRDATNKCTTPVFTYTSSRLEYDDDPVDGVTSAKELDDAPGLGNGNYATQLASGIHPFPDGDEPDVVDAIAFSFRVIQGSASEDFYSEAQMRNQR